MKRIESGSVLAFDELYERYVRRAYRVAGSVCRDGVNAEEAVQEAFISLWRTRSTYRPERGSVAAWLLTSVRYKAIDIVRRDRGHISHDTITDRLVGFRAIPDGVADHAVDRDDAAHLRLLLMRIPEPQREVITLAFYGQLTHVEIATHLELPAGTVKGRMRLGLEKLRAQIELDAK